MKHDPPRINKVAKEKKISGGRSWFRRMDFLSPIIAAISFSSGVVHSQSTPSIQKDTTPVFQQAALTAVGLAKVARDLPDSDRLRVTKASLSIFLLVKFDRLLPNLPPAAINNLADIFFAESPDPSEQLAAAAKLPPADTVVYDGQRLVGGNFRNIDSLMGLGGHPVALDRELPAWIVPLEPARAQALDSTTSAGYPAQQFADLKNLVNGIYSAEVGNHLVTDGLFLRPYAGRMDDLYHHLVQQEGRTGLLDYYALLDCLPSRQYGPLSGTAARQSVPPLRVSLSNVLSGGSLQAIQNFKKENPRANDPNPFIGFAVRTLSFLPDLIRKTPAGSDLKLSREHMLRAISDPRRYSPGKVPPLFLDPSRFLGQWEDPRFIRVSKKKRPSKSALIEEIQKVDFETPLPEMSFEPAGNALLASNPAEPAPDADLLKDLGLPPQVEKTTKYERADAPEPVLPPSSLSESGPPVASPPPEKPAPPLLDAVPLETPPVFDLAQAPTPPPPVSVPSSSPAASTDLVVEQPVAAPMPSQAPDSKPSPRPLKPSAIAVIPPQDFPLPTPSATSAAFNEPQVARAIPVSPNPQAPSYSGAPYQVAVLTPTAKEAIDYLKKISASDIALSNTLAASRRFDSISQWLVEAVKPFESNMNNTPDSTVARSVEPLLVQARDELVALRKDRENLQTALIEELKSRQAARQAIENEIQTTRRDELARRIGVGA